MLLSTAYYRTLTGDVASSDASVASAASAAQDLLEADLGRVGVLESAERTEVCLLEDDGTIYPRARPITAIDGGYEVVDDVVYGAVPDIAAFVGLIDTVTTPRRATITYTGGWTADTVPEPVLFDLAWATYWILNGITGAASKAAAGVAAQSVRLGDAAITYRSGANSILDFGLSWSTATWRLRERDA